jgi:hypothetical protein
MILAAHQPNYLPNLGFFYKMSQADLLVIFTNAQFTKGECWMRRHRIPGPNNDIWLTVPVRGSGQHQCIREVQIENTSRWRHAHRRTLLLTYQKTADPEILMKLLKIYESRWGRLVDLNLAFIHCLREILGISTPVVLDEEVTGQKEELLINLCTKYGATTYLSGVGGKLYMTAEYFQALEEHGIAHRFIDRNLTAAYPYSTVHYLLRYGLPLLQEVLRNPEATFPEEPFSRRRVGSPPAMAQSPHAP